MHLHDLIQNATALSRQPDQQSWQVGDKVLRLIRLPERMLGERGRLDGEVVRQARVAQVSGVPPWRKFRYLRESERQGLGLAQGHWLVAVRDWVDGVTLIGACERGSRDWMDLALSVAYRLRELHEHGYAHGDLQPGNIIVGDDDRLWLIDVPVVSTTSQDRGHVAGSAPLMAPERWEGAAASADSDVYALGALVCWLATGGRWPLEAERLTQWAQTHRHRRAEIPARIEGRLAGVVARMLAKRRDQRPPLQSLIDALVDAGASAALPAVCPLPDAIDASASSVLEALEGGVPTVVVVDRDRKLFASPILGQCARRLELAGDDVLEICGARIASALEAPDTEPADPWELAYAVVEAVSKDPSVRERLRREAGRGDQLHTFETFSDALIEALPDDGLTVVWERFDEAGPDVRKWWVFVTEQARVTERARTYEANHAGRRGRLRCVLGSRPPQEAEDVAIITPAEEAAAWGRWRASTLRTEVRDIAGGHWKQLVERARGRPDRLVQLINERVGAQFGSENITIRDSGVYRAPVAAERWKERYDALVGRGAFSQAAQCCQEVYARRDALAAKAVRQVLGAWTDVVLRGVASSEHARQLEAALVFEMRSQADARDVAPFAAVAFARLVHSSGRHDEGLERLEALALDEASADFARCRLWQAQLNLSSGNLEQARDFAREGLEVVDTLDDAGLEGERVHLELIVHGAGAIFGERDDIQALEALLVRMEGPQIAPVLRARCHAYRALGLTRHDRLDEATDAYRRALEIIEAAGLDAELPIYLLNVGTAYHRQGRLGLAREYYARGIRLAQQTTRASTRALLYANQANIEQALGRLEEARASLDRAWQVAREHELGSVQVLCYSMQGEICLAEGALEAALESYRRPLDDEALPLTSFARAELLLHSSEACLLSEDLTQSQQLLDEARTLIEQDELAGLEGYHGMLRARLQWEEGSAVGVMAGIELFRRSLMQTAEAGNHKLVLRQSPFLWALLEREGLHELMEEVFELVTTSRNAIAMGLTRELREDFFSQLPTFSIDATEMRPDAAARSRTRRPSGGGGQPSADARGIWRSRRRHSSASAAGSAAAGATIERFYRMLSLNEVILQSDDLAKLAPKALEIALSLSGAERGFILLRKSVQSQEAAVGEFGVVASRDLRGKPIATPHLEVSMTIAEEAASTGQTVVTVNAQDDQRFEAALSVVDLNLTSVLCVPIRNSSGLLGALYLDHRFQPGIFEGEITRMMEAFGHQLALAVTNVRRLDALERERRSLEEATEQLDELLREREIMLGELRERCEVLSEEVERQRRTSPVRSSFEHIAFASRTMEDVLVQVERVAKSDIPLVITGESGVGKELIAEAVHQASPRSQGPFVAFNCGAVSETLMESEMFGHKKGAFTGAEADREGFFRAADGGTIFLDEVGEMPLSMQVKLLRVLQERKVRRVGSTRADAVDVRVVCATNRSLEEMVDDGSFREDLYYRLAAFVIEVPPLRERREDIPLIARKLLDRIAEEASGEKVRLEAQAARLLSQAHWQGNVRELENTLRAACALADSTTLGERDVAPLLRIRESSGRSGPTARRPQRAASRSRLGRKPKCGRAEVVEALERADGDRDAAAELLGVSVRTLYRYQKKYEIE